MLRVFQIALRATMLFAMLFSGWAFAKDEPATKLWRSTRDKSLYIRFPSCWKDSPGSRAFDAGEQIEFQPSDKCAGFSEGQWKIAVSKGAAPQGGSTYKGPLPAGVALRRVDTPSSSVWMATFACAAGAVHVNFTGNLALGPDELRDRAKPTKTLLEFLSMVGCEMAAK